MTEADKHLKVLRALARRLEREGKSWRKSYRKDIPNDPYLRYAREEEKNVAAIRWVLSLNAFGVTDDEVVG